MVNKKFSWTKRVKSFRYAFNGIKLLLKNEHNAWIHSIIALVVIVCGFLFQISSVEWLAVILCVGLVLMAEAFNTAIETLADRVNTEEDQMIKKTKDIAAGAVLLVAIASIFVGLIIFVPKIIVLLK